MLLKFSSEPYQQNQILSAMKSLEKPVIITGATSWCFICKRFILSTDQAHDKTHSLWLNQDPNDHKTEILTNKIYKQRTTDEHGIVQNCTQCKREITASYYIIIYDAINFLNYCEYCFGELRNSSYCADDVEMIYSSTQQPGLSHIQCRSIIRLEICLMQTAFIEAAQHYCLSCDSSFESQHSLYSHDLSHSIAIRPCKSSSDKKKLKQILRDPESTASTYEDLFKCKATNCKAVPSLKHPLYLGEEVSGAKVSIVMLCETCFLLRHDKEKIENLILIRSVKKPQVHC